MSEQTTRPAGEEGEAREPDLVLVILRRVVAECPGVDPATVVAIEQEVRSQYGGRRYFVPKKKKHLSPADRQRLVEDGLSAKSTREVTDTNGVHRSTLYRSLKRFANRD